MCSSDLFQDQEKNYSIRFVKAGYKTDADSLYNALIDKWEELDLSEKKGDRGFVILDIDNDPLKAQKVSVLEILMWLNGAAKEFLIRVP